MNTDYNTIQLHSIVLHSFTTPCLQTIRLPIALAPSDVPAPPHDIFLKSSVRTFQLIRSRLVLTNKTSFLTICIVGFLHTTTHPHIYYPSTEFF